MHRQSRNQRRLLLGLVMSAAVLAGSTTVTLDAQAQDTVEDARQQREDARREQAAAAAELELAKADDAEVAEALAAVTLLVDAQQIRVDEARRQLAANKEDLLVAQAAVVSAEVEEATLEEGLSKQAISGFVASGDSTGTFLESEDLSTAIRQQVVLSEFNGDTSDVLEQLLIVQEDRAVAQVQADHAVDESVRIEADLAVVLVDLEAQQAVQADLKAEMETRVQKWRTALANAEVEEQDLTDFIRAEERKAAGPAPAPAPEAGNPSAQGFQWPISAPITSNFGYRVHPIYGTRRLHKGMDFGAGSGRAIAAAKGGTVITAGWISGYGNTVIISHGSGLTTLYAHQSKLAVSVGQSVGRGQTIGYVGSTGNSTGPHLHFEVRSNGTPVNPRPYLP